MVKEVESIGVHLVHVKRMVIETDHCGMYIPLSDDKH